MNIKFFNKWYYLVIAYALIIILTSCNLLIPSAAMRDFNLTISLSYVILYLFHVNNNRLEYIIAISILLVVLLLTSATLIDTTIDVLGYLLFVKFFKLGKLFKTVYLITIIITGLMFVLLPVLISIYQGITISYKDLFLSSVYVRYLLSVFPAYLITQWSINGVLINIIIKKKKLKVS